MTSSAPQERLPANVPEPPRRRTTPRISERLTIWLAFALALLLTLASAVWVWRPELFLRCIPGHSTVVVMSWIPELRALWPFCLACIQLAGTTLILIAGGLPRTRSARLAFAAINLELISLLVFSATHTLDLAFSYFFKVGLRLAILGTWTLVVAGIPIIVWRVVTRDRRSARRSSTLARWWLFAAVLLVVGESCSAVIRRIDLQSARIAFPESLRTPPPDEMHIAAVGESTMAGFPYTKRFGIPKVVARQLQAMYPGRKIEVDDVSEVGVNLRSALEQVKRLPCRPHLMLLYSGHNEFFHEPEELTLEYSAPWRGLDAWLAWSPTFNLCDRKISRIFAVQDFRWSEAPQLIERNLATPSVLQMRIDRFRDQLEQFGAWCRRSDIPVLWYLPAGSESDYEPTRSCLSHPSTVAEREGLMRTSAAARRLKAEGRWMEAAQAFRQVLDVNPTIADFLYQLAECQMQQGDHAGAARNFALALEHDGFPIRMLKSYGHQITEAAARFQIPVVDAAGVLRPHTQFGILNRSVFVDYVHPNLRSYYLLGMAAVDSLEHAGVLRARFGEPTTIAHVDFAATIQTAGLNANDLALAYLRVSEGDARMARRRYESSRIDRDTAQFRQWSRALRTGEITPGEKGIESLK